MTSERIFACLCRYLEPKVQAANGIFAQSETVEETLGMLTSSPGRWRCILQWQREEPVPNARGVHELSLLVIIQQAKGLPAQSGLGAVLAQPGHKALLERANEVFRWMRAVVFDNHDIDKVPLRQGKTQWMSDPAFPTRQISAVFSLNYGLETVTMQHLTVSA